MSNPKIGKMYLSRIDPDHFQLGLMPPALKNAYHNRHPDWLSARSN
jgi:hypothetical protein